MKINDSGVRTGTYRDFYTSKNPSTKTSEAKSKKINLPVVTTTIAGTLIPMLIIRKYQGKGIKKGALLGMDFISKAKATLKSFGLEYGLKEMIFASFGSILGGMTGGLLFNKNENKKSKVKESVFQLANIAIPTTLVAKLLKQAEKSKNPKNILPKIVAVVTGIGAGMPLAAVVSDKINNTIIDKNNPTRREIRLKDCFVHIDDLLGAFVLAKIPFANKLQVEKVLPLLYGICGYEAGIEK